VRAESAGGAVTVDTAAVGVLAVKPALVPPGGLIGHAELSSLSRITLGVGVGGTNRCTSGVWLHHPTRSAYLWLEVHDGKRIVGRKSKYKLGAGDAVGRRLHCQVTPSNGAAASVPAQSVSYDVRPAAPLVTNEPGPDAHTLRPTRMMFTDLWRWAEWRRSIRLHLRPAGDRRVRSRIRAYRKRAPRTPGAGRTGCHSAFDGRLLSDDPGSSARRVVSMPRWR